MRGFSGKIRKHHGDMEMDDFASMMARQGVKPIAPPQPAPAKAWHPGERDAAQPKAAAPPPAPTPRWSVGAEGRAQLSNAISRMVEGERTGIRCFITFVDVNGHTARTNLAPNATTVDKVLAEADRMRARAVIIGGPGWTCMMHPLAGATTIARDPVGDPA
jgi:hypothetical protein